MSWINLWLLSNLYLYKSCVLNFWKVNLDHFGGCTEMPKWTHKPESSQLHCQRNHFTVCLRSSISLPRSQSDFQEAREFLSLLTLFFCFFLSSDFAWIWVWVVFLLLTNYVILPISCLAPGLYCVLFHNKPQDCRVCVWSLAKPVRTVVSSKYPL